MARIGKNMLRERIKTLIELVGDDTIHLSCAYGGYSLRREGEDLLHSGYVTARDLYNRMNCYMFGYMDRKEQDES